MWKWTRAINSPEIMFLKLKAMGIFNWGRGCTFAKCEFLSCRRKIKRRKNLERITVKGYNERKLLSSSLGIQTRQKIKSRNREVEGWGRKIAVGLRPT